MRIIVTGGAGFIGSAIVWRLNQLGYYDILIVDRMDETDKWKNLVPLQFDDLVDADDFLDELDVFDDVDALIHMGACSSTAERDSKFLLSNNYQYTKDLLDLAREHEMRFIYASSAATYGDGSAGMNDGIEDLGPLRPLNAYGYSKHLFDQYAARYGMFDYIVGLKFFNVFGPNEEHKGRMATVARHACQQFLTDGRVRLFVGSDGFADGEQRRDFVHVDDVANVNLHFLEHPEVSGIYNCGTGRAQSFNDVATAVINTVRATEGHPPLASTELAAQGLIEYIPFPPQLEGKYQSFTEADLGQLRAAGYPGEFMTVEQGVGAYVRELLGK